MLPSFACIGAMEDPLAGSKENVGIRSDSQPIDAAHKRGQRSLLPFRTAIGRNQYAGACGCHKRLVISANRNEVLLTHNRTASPNLSLIGTGVQTGRSSG